MEVNEIHNIDALEGLKKLNDNVIDVTVTSPPYYNIKKYSDGFTPWKSYDDYLYDNKKWFCELYRVTKEGGYVFWNVQDTIAEPTKKGRNYHSLASDIIQIASKELTKELFINDNFVYEGSIIWLKNNCGSQVIFGSYPYVGTPIFMMMHEPILIFRKRGKRKLDKLKVDKETWFSSVRNIWSISTVRSSKMFHDAPFPEEIVERILSVTTDHNSIVLDPFMGSGTTAVVSVKMKRNYIGFEISKFYCEKAEERILNSIPVNIDSIFI